MMIALRLSLIGLVCMLFLPPAALADASAAPGSTPGIPPSVSSGPMARIRLANRCLFCCSSRARNCFMRSRSVGAVKQAGQLSCTTGSPAAAAKSAVWRSRT